METTYKFDIVQVFTSNVNIDGIQDQLVDRIEFSLIGYKEDQNTFIIDEVIIPNVSSQLIPYKQLTKDQLLNWVTEFFDQSKIDQMKDEINNKLDEMIAHFAQFNNENSNIISKPSLPPWAITDIPSDAFIVDVKPTIPEGV